MKGTPVEFFEGVGVVVSGPIHVPDADSLFFVVVVQADGSFVPRTLEEITYKELPYDCADVLKRYYKPSRPPTIY